MEIEKVKVTHLVWALTKFLAVAETFLELAEKEGNNPSFDFYTYAKQGFDMSIETLDKIKSYELNIREEKDLYSLNLMMQVNMTTLDKIRPQLMALKNAYKYNV